MTALTGDELPALRTEVPGPRSRALAGRLRRVESRNITRISDDGPVFWADARGAVVRDADGNDYVDLTAGFGVAMAGHAEPRVARAIALQAARLPHALGDVHPADTKVALLEALARLAPGDLGTSILASSGAEAVEAALKTAVMRTGRTGIIAFEGAYHGLTYGALATTWRKDFRAPFRSQLFDGVRFAPYPLAGIASDDDVAAAIAGIEYLIATAETGSHPVGAILIEPVQGRGGIRVPAAGFLTGLRRLCDGRTRVLIADEIYTGFGRTGQMFACSHWDVVPDILVVGKALGGGVPISAAIAAEELMSAWPLSTGEAIHTSTFLGNPIACAAALAQIAAIEEGGLVARAAHLGGVIRARVDAWAAAGLVSHGRGLGLLQAAIPHDDVAESTRRSLSVADRALRHGVLVLAEGISLEALALTPPAVITEPQLGSALGILEDCLEAVA